MKRKNSGEINTSPTKRQKTNSNPIDRTNVLTLGNAFSGNNKTSKEDLKFFEKELNKSLDNNSKIIVRILDHELSHMTLSPLFDIINNSRAIGGIILSFNAPLSFKNIQVLAGCIGNNKNIEEVTINTSKLEGKDIAELISAIQNNQSIHNLIITRSLDIPAKFDRLHNLLTLKQNITTLNINYCNLDDGYFCKELFDGISYNKSLINLSFANSKFTETTFDSLIKALEENKTIKNLNFVGCNLSQEMITKLNELMKKKPEITFVAQNIEKPKNKGKQEAAEMNDSRKYMATNIQKQIENSDQGKVFHYKITNNTRSKNTKKGSNNISSFNINDPTLKLDDAHILDLDKFTGELYVYQIEDLMKKISQAQSLNIKKHVKFGINYIQHDAFNKLCNSVISKFNNINEVTIDLQHSYTDKQTNILVNAIKNNKFIEKLTINTSHLNNYEIENFANKLKEHPRINSLTLIYNQANYDGRFKGFSSLLENNKVIKTFAVQNANLIFQNDFKELYGGLAKNSAITDLSLENCTFNDESFAGLISALRINQSIRYLNLSGCNLTQAMASELHDFIQATPRITDVNLINNVNINEDLQTEILNQADNNLSNYNNHEPIIIDDNYLPEVQYTKAQYNESYQNPQTYDELKTTSGLDYSNLKLDEDNFATLNDILYQYNNIKHLALNNKVFANTRHMDIIGYALGRNLESISFQNCQFDENSFDILAKSLSKNNNLTSINLEGTNVSHAMGTKLVNLLKSNPNILEVKLNGSLLQMYYPEVYALVDSQLAYNNYNKQMSNRDDNSFTKYINNKGGFNRNL